MVYESKVGLLKKEKEINTAKTTQSQCNKKILNTIIYNKLKRQLKMQDLTVKDLQDNQVQYQNIENDAKDSILSFRVANEMLRYNKETIQYDQILNKIIQEKNAPKKIFEFTQELQQIDKQNNDYPIIEKTVLQKNQNISNEIKEHKEQQLKNCNALYQLQKDYQKNEQTIEELRSRLQNETQLHEKRNQAQHLAKPKQKSLLSKSQVEF